jgi:hypothetical protein
MSVTCLVGIAKPTAASAGNSTEREPAGLRRGRELRRPKQPGQVSDRVYDKHAVLGRRSRVEFLFTNFSTTAVIEASPRRAGG